MAEQKKEMSFENALTRLEETVKALESGELSLEKSLKCFEDGVKLARTCQKHLAGAEKRVEVLTGQDNGRPVLQPFGEQES